MKTVTVKQIQTLDRMAIETYGVPSLALMENAGRSVARTVMDSLKRMKNPKVAIVCGLGNNAGDGFVAARHLMNAGVNPAILLIGRGSRLKRDAAVNYHILKKLKYPMYEMKADDEVSLQKHLNRAVVIDAIFGVGLNRIVQDPFKSVIEMINEKAKKVISVDIPSGLDGDTGRVHGVYVKADTTVTFTLAKKGLVKNQGRKQAGNIVVADIGVPAQLKGRI